MSISIASRVAVLLALGAGTFASLIAVPDRVYAQSATTTQKKKLLHDVKQANLYIKLKYPERARELLEPVVEAEPGRSDALTWLALGRAYYFERRLDDAGRAVEQARSLGLREAAKSAKWARRFAATFKRHVGALILDGGACEAPQFTAKLAAPMPNKTRRALLDSVPGWRSGTLKRARSKRFYLPAGRYRFGSLRVKVLAGEFARVSAEEIGAECPVSVPPVAMAVPAPQGPSDLVSPTTATAREQRPSWFEENWVWVVVGSVVVVAGTATAIGLATAGGGPDQVNFNPNPGSFRN